MSTILKLVHARQNLFLIAVVSTTAVSTGLYLTKRFLDRSCPRVPITALPRSSACRNLVERAVEGTGDVEKDGSITRPQRNLAWGLEDLQQGPLLASWPGRNGDENDSNVKTHRITSFVALQAEIPVSLLEGYVSTAKKSNSHHAMPATQKPLESYTSSTSSLAETFLAGFLDARATDPESWFLDDRDMPPLSFTPGTQVNGRRDANSGLFGAFILGTWSSTSTDKRPINTAPSVLPIDVPRLPVTEFPSNRDTISSTNLTSDEDATGAVYYYRFTRSLFLEGGFQEFIVERMPGNSDMVRVSYVPVECAAVTRTSTAGDGLTLGRNAEGNNGGYTRGLPWILYEAHVFYAQFLLWNTIRHLRKNCSSRM